MKQLIYLHFFVFRQNLLIVIGISCQYSFNTILLITYFTIFRIMHFKAAFIS